MNGRYALASSTVAGGAAMVYKASELHGDMRYVAVKLFAVRNERLRMSVRVHAVHPAGRTGCLASPFHVLSIAAIRRESHAVLVNRKGAVSSAFDEAL